MIVMIKEKKKSFFSYFCSVNEEMLKEGFVKGKLGTEVLLLSPPFTSIVSRKKEKENGEREKDVSEGSDKHLITL